MLLTSKIIDELLDNKFEIDFPVLRLTQMSHEPKKVFSGPGSISQDSNGVLRLKLYLTYDSPEQFHQDFRDEFARPQLPPGKIIPESKYFSLAGMDMHGRGWFADRVWASGDLSMPAQGRIIRAKVNDLTSTTKLEHTPAKQRKIHFGVSTLVDLPWNDLDVSEKSISRSRFTVAVEDGPISVTKLDRYTSISISVPEIENPNDYATCIIDSISFATGYYLQPFFESLNDGSVIRTTLFSRRDIHRADRFLPALPQMSLTHSDDLADFVRTFSKLGKNRHSLAAGYWYRIYSAYGGNIENQALVLSTAIEGLLKAYFKDLGKPDADFVAQVQEFQSALDEIKVGDRVKQRVKSSLSNALSQTSKSALHALETSGSIPKHLIPIWNRLRNQSAHADELNMDDSTLQKLLDDVHGCLELFIRLVALASNYSGALVQYSQPSWPSTK